ncbi:MAG: LPS-assembly protein LptD [Paraprevotella sp.]|nr:LPS-assembly protein LptD [Paraprevotella sp.]MCI6200640.1 LPS-assembly protein LptD [Paraprevotella sp.]
MRTKTVIFILLCAFIFVMADNSLPINGKRNKRKKLNDSISQNDSSQKDTSSILSETDTLKMDSLQKAIYLHNKHVDDSVRLDSINRSKSIGLDAPVYFSSEDSLVYDAKNKQAKLFGNSDVKYENMNLISDRMQMSLDSSVVYATGSADTTGKIKGRPIFTMGEDKYESDTIACNFKTKRAFINNVYTEQQDGFLSSQQSKRDSSGVLYLQHGRYTTCDREHPDFYIALSRAKVRPGKDVVFGPAYLVVADVPLPLAIPYGFFPFTKSYSSGFIMPTYGDESSRGFYLRDGGYYFAINDKWDLKLLGEIYTKGSWGLSVASNYNKRYRYSGSFYFSYQNTKNGDKGMPDYAQQTSFKIQWSHRQDSKANPFSSLSASVNFATTSYERNNLTSMYNPQSYTQSLRTSSVNWSSTFSSIGMTLSGTANLSQNMRDSTISLSLPDLNISVSRFYPFKRKHMVGKERWYEKISMSYTGHLSNSIDTKEDLLFKSDLVNDWRNGFQHNIPINANFTIFDYININASLSFTDRMYSNKILKSWNTATQTEVVDTLHGFYNVYDWRLSLGMSTKLYGMFKPSPKFLGGKILALRHVITPTVTFNYAPDFSTANYGYYDSYQKTDADGNVTLVQYSPYERGMFGVPGKGKTGSFTFDLGNNIEMKIKSDKDSTGYKKISIIDELGLSMSYNMAAKERPLSDLTMRIRLKWWKNYTFNMNAVFATYAYELDENGRPYVGTHTEYGRGRFGRFQGMSQNFSFTLNPEKLKKLFGRSDDKDDTNNENDETDNTDIETNVDDDMVRGQKGAKRNTGKAETDEDGYMKFSMPWSLTFGYGITMRENTSGRFNTNTMRYPYKFTQNLNFSGNVRISDGWNISFSSGYDFEDHDISMTTASLQRDLHCFSMSCSVVLAPYTSYNFSFRCNAATLTDALKYDKRSGYTNAVQWY